MNEQIKDKIKHGQEPRFLPATESIAHARLDNFRSKIKEFQKEHPEILGATVYGSMIKGDQAKATSDIDAYVYIDEDKIPKDIWIDNTYLLEQLYLKKFENKLDLPEGDFGKYYHDMKTKVLSDNILQNEIENFIDYEKDNEAHKAMLKTTYRFDMLEEEKEALFQSAPALAHVSPAIAGMFHARVGTGIDKYRHLFLEKINALPDRNLARKIWESTQFTLNTFEKREDPTKTIEIPSTLDHALRIYHPDLYKTTKKQEDEAKIYEEKLKIEASFNK